jgi:hypothetical protein
MRIGIKLYQGAIAAKDFFERAGIGPLMPLAKLALAVVTRVVRAA